MRGQNNKLAQSSPIEIALLSDLKPPRRNGRTHSKKQIRQIANSILRFGWTYPILTDENKQIIAGVGRSKAAEQLGSPQPFCCRGTTPVKRLTSS